MDEKRKSWEAKLGIEISDDLLHELEGAAAGDDPPMRVYLSSGEVDEIRPASAVFMTADSVEVRYGDQTVAVYQRSKVWSASKDRISPSLG